MEPSGPGSWSRKLEYTEVRVFPTPKVAAGRSTRTTPGGTRTHNPWLRRPVPYPLGHWGATTRGFHVVRGNAQPHARAPPVVPPRRRPARAPRNRSGLLPAARKARVRGEATSSCPAGTTGRWERAGARRGAGFREGDCRAASGTGQRTRRRSPTALRKINPCEDKRGPTACCPSRCPNTPR
uniref:Uncharacterized protein n=1 Tax=Mustela putorius furo TaxID=9669 RepID=M3YRL5_MUSPF